MGLISKDEKKRNDTYNELYGNIFHQGTRWEVTPYVVQFLYDILDKDETEGKEELIEYLIHLATGYPEEYMPYGINVKYFYNEPVIDINEIKQDIFCRMEQQKQGILYNCETNPTTEYHHDQVAEKDYDESEDDEDDDDEEELDYSDMDYTMFARETYYNYVAGQEILCKCTYSDQKTVRMQAIYALAFCGALIKDEIFDRVKEVAFLSDNDIERSNALIALAMISLNKQESDLIQNVIKEIKKVYEKLSEDDILEKVASSCALILMEGANQNKEELLYMASLSSEDLEANRELLPYSCYDLKSYISSVLTTIKGESLLLCIQTLASYLKGLNCFESYRVTSSLLQLMEIENPKPFNEENITIDMFSEVSQGALIEIAKHGGFKWGDGNFGNYSLLLSSYHLPSHYEEFLAFVTPSKLFEANT